MADTVTVEAPSGLVVTLREWKVSEENLAASPKTIREGKPKTALLEAATVAVEDPGPYDLTSTGRLKWDDVLHGDREVALRDNRVNTWEDDYYRDDPCPLCDQPTENWFKLSSFPVKALPALSLEHVKTNKPLVTVLPRCGKKVEFRLFRGRDEKDLAKIYNFREDERSSEILKLRIVSIDGVDPKELGKFVVDMGGKDASALRGAIEAADCGIEQEGVWRCKCGNRWTGDVNFNKDFFFPKHRVRTG